MMDSGYIHIIPDFLLYTLPKEKVLDRAAVTPAPPWDNQVVPYLILSSNWPFEGSRDGAYM